MKTYLATRRTGFCSAVLAIAASAALLPQAQAEMRILSFGSNGQMVWSDPGGVGKHYAIQWASSLDGKWHNWQDSMTNFTGLGPNGTSSVPVFYRVVDPDPTYQTNAYYTYYENLPGFNPATPLDPNEMRITFMGTMIPLPVRKAQAEMSVFVEVGWNPDPNDSYYHGRAVDQAVFDCGAGVSANYAAASVGFRRMDKVFVNHLHGDHMNDLTHIYTFGPSGDRKSPLYVFGSSPSGVESPAGSGKIYNDGTSNFCAQAREVWRWHSESFSFQPTRYVGYKLPTKASWGLPVDPIPVGDDPPDDGYALVPIELDWTKYGGIAYSNNDTHVKISHYPVIHARKGSMGYKFEWTPPGGSKPMTMIYSSDTKPESNSVTMACNGTNGVDVFIHEMVVPPDVWAYKQMGLLAPPATNDPLYTNYLAAVNQLTLVQDSSHTPQGAYGYLLSQIKPAPRLAVATHFPVSDDTVASAFKSVAAHCTNIVFGKDIVWSFDLMILRVYPDRIDQYRGVVSDFVFNPPTQFLTNSFAVPKYHDTNGVGDPYAQIDQTTAIPAVYNGTTNYNSNGY